MISKKKKAIAPVRVPHKRGIEQVRKTPPTYPNDSASHDAHNHRCKRTLNKVFASRENLMGDFGIRTPQLILPRRDENKCRPKSVVRPRLLPEFPSVDGQVQSLEHACREPFLEERIKRFFQHHVRELRRKLQSGLSRVIW
jgi:hypothetical protein